MATAPRRRAADKSATATETQPIVNAKPMGFAADAQTALATVTLDMIQKATAEGSYVFLSPEAVVHFGVSVETNAAMKFNDYIAARAAANAPQASNPQPESTNPVTEQTQNATPAVAKSSFEIVENFAMPTARKPGNGNTKYPFDALNVGAAFFVPGGTVKALASTVASANARYAEAVKHPDGSPVTRTNRKGKTVQATKQTRMFQVRAGKNAAGVDGAFVGRLPVAE